MRISGESNLERVHGTSQGSIAQRMNEDTIDLGKLLATLWRAKLLIMASCALLMIVAGYYIYFLATPTFSSTATVMLENREEQIVDLQSVVGGIGADTTAINTELEVLASRALMGKVVDKLDLMNDPEFNDALVEPSRFTRLKKFAKLKLGILSPNDLETKDDPEAVRRRYEAVVANLTKHVSTRNVPSSLVFEVTITSENATKASRIADTVVELYIRNQVDVKLDAQEQATSWLSERVSTLQADLEASESKLNEFRSGSDLVSAEMLSALEIQLKDLRDRVAGLQQEQEHAKARQTAYNAAVTPQEKAEALDDDQLKQFLSRIDNPDVAATFDARAEQAAQRVSQNIQRNAVQLVSLQNAQDALQQQISEQTNELIRIQQLQRDMESNRLLYEYFLNRLKETSVQRGIQQADARVLSYAQLPVEPASPKKKQLFSVAAILGLLIGCGIALLREARNDTYRLGEEMEQGTGYNVMGLLPLIPGRKRYQRIAYIREKPTSAAAEAIRNLRTSILLADMAHPPKVILCTSALPGEGKTTVSVALAQNLASMGKRVLLIEGDMRRQVIRQYGEAPSTKREEHGLFSAILEGEDPMDHVSPDKVLGIDMLLAGTTTMNPADLLSSAKFSQIMQSLRQHYDYIIMDTPPVLIVPDARVAAQHADAVMLVVRWDSTSRSQVRGALRELESVHRPVDGLILNQIDPHGLKRYGYGERYGAHYAYGNGYYGR